MPDASATQSLAASASLRAAAKPAGACPVTPSGVVVKAGRSKVDLSWTAPPIEGPVVTIYRISVQPGGRVVDVAAGRPAATITDLDNGVEYAFTVTAINDHGASVPSPAVRGTPSLGEPAEVERLIVAYEPGVPVVEEPGRATGSAALKDVALIPDAALGAGMRTVEISEGVSERTAERLAAELTADPRVKWAEPDTFVPLLSATVPNDTYYANGSMWGLNGTYGIKAPQAWGVTQGSPSTVVAVLDTGITAHPDLAGQTVAGYDMIVDPAVSRDGDGRDGDASDPGDTYLGSSSSWHGTHVAGTINALADNATGVVGVAPRVKVQPVRVLGSGGGYISDIVAGITWASGGSVPGVPANPTPARVISMSLGGAAPCGAAENTAISAANARNTVVVVAAGNSDADASGFTPAGCDGVIAVAATDSSGKRASFSNYGARVDVAAPGMSIVSTLNSGTTAPGAPSYAYYSGTSMATPHVSGVVALMLSQNPSLTPAQVETRVKSSALATGFPGGRCDADLAKTCGAGIINAAALLGSAPAPTPVTGVSVSPTSVSVAVGASTQLTATVTPATATNPSVTWTTSSPAVATVSATGVVNATAPGSATITATTADGNLTATSLVTVTGSVAVTGISVAPAALTLSPGSVGVLTATVTPSDATNRAITWTSSNPLSATVSAGGTVAAVSPGTATITARSVDGGRTATALVTVTRNAQVITFQAPSSLALAQSPYTLVATASSGLPVTFTAGGSCSVSGSALTLLGPGTCSVVARQVGSDLYLPAPGVERVIAVGKRPQVVTFAPPSMVLAGTTTRLRASAASGLPVSFSTSTPSVCTITASTLLTVQGGTCVVTAGQPGNDEFESATDQVRSITVVKRSQGLDIAGPTRLVAGQSAASLRAFATSGLPVTFTSATPTVCSVDGSAITPLMRGSCAIDVRQAGDGVWSPVARTWRMAVFGKPQSIAFDPLSNAQVNDAPLTLAATASSGLAVAFTAQPASVCSVTSGSLTFIASGRCSVTAWQPGDGEYEAAAPVTRALMVNPARTTITLTSASLAASTLAPITFTAAVSDANGAPQAGRVVAFYARAWSGWSGGYSLVGKTVTDAAGTASMPITFDRANRYEVLAEASATAQFASARSSSTVEISRIATTTTVDRAPNSTSASGASNRANVATAGTPVTFTAKVIPQTGTPQPNMVVAFSTRTGSGPWSYRGVALTDPAGEARLPISFGTAGAYQVRAEVTGTIAYGSSVGTTGPVEVTRRP